MDPATVLADVQLAVSLAKMAIDLGRDVAPYVTRAYQIAFENKALTDTERQVMTDQETAMRGEIDAIIAADAAATD